MRNSLRKTSIFLSGILLLILIVIIVVVWPKQYNYATDEPFLVVTTYSAGPDDFRNMYDESIAINNDGHLVLYSTGSDDLIIKDDAPTLEMQLHDEQVEQIKEVIEEAKFWKLPTDVSTPSEDGGYGYVTVNLTNSSKKVGGLNPDNERFFDVFQSARVLIDQDDYENWQKEIEEHIWENNSLHSSKKTDFVTDEPFLVLKMEANWGDEFNTDWTDDISSVYHHQISIDMDGNLVLSAKLNEGSEMQIRRNAPELTIQLSDSELEEAQELIQEHFWKLNEFIKNPDGRDRMESITVHLTEEEKMVRGADPIDQKFTAIRDYMIDLIDEEAYESWTEEVEEELWEENALHSNKKTDYIKDEPFLILSMERNWEEDFINRYSHHISIDMDGEVVLYAEAGLGVEIGDNAPILEIHVQDKELETVKELIEEHFWKIDGYNYHSRNEGDMESITVNLTEDEVKIEGDDPDDDNFMSIRNELIDMIGDETYESWVKDIEKYIVEENPDL